MPVSFVVTVDSSVGVVAVASGPVVSVHVGKSACRLGASCDESVTSLGCVGAVVGASLSHSVGVSTVGPLIGVGWSTAGAGSVVYAVPSVASTGASCGVLLE